MVTQHRVNHSSARMDTMTNHVIPVKRNPIVLWCITLPLLIVLLVPAELMLAILRISTVRHKPSFETWTPPILLIVFVAGCVWVVLEFMLLSYRTTFTDEGIEQRGAIRRKQIKWLEIEQIRGRSTHVISLKSPDASVTLSLWNYADQEAVIAIIAGRLPTAAQIEYEEFVRHARSHHAEETMRRPQLRRNRRIGIVLVVASALVAVVFSHFQMDSMAPRICVVIGVTLGIVLFCIGSRDEYNT
jgi:hypothetical protein